MSEPTKCKHCSGYGTCSRPCCTKHPERKYNEWGRYDPPCTVCGGTSYYNPNRIIIDLSGIPSTVSSEDIKNLREYAEALTSITNLHRELIALKSVDRKIESEDLEA